MPVELRSMLLRDFTSLPLGKFPVHATKACRGRKDISLIIRNLGSRKNLWYPYNSMLGGPQSRSGRLGEDESLTSAGNRTPDGPTHSLVTIDRAVCRYSGLAAFV